MRWTITTGKNKWTSKGSSAFEAAVKASKKRPPKIAGLVTKAKPSRGSTIWMLTELILKKAGYAFEAQEE